MHWLKVLLGIEEKRVSFTSKELARKLDSANTDGWFDGYNEGYHYGYQLGLANGSIDAQGIKNLIPESDI